MLKIQSLSLLKLILLGFVVVALPLVGAIITAISQVDSLAVDSSKALTITQKNINTGRLLAERVTELERSARQYHVLQDASYKRLYLKYRKEVLITFDALIKNNENSEIAHLVDLAKKSELFSYQNFLLGSEISREKLTQSFSSLRENSLAILRKHNELAKKLSSELPTRAESLQRILISQAVLVMPLSAGLGLLFVLLISRPLRQIDQGIRSLGHGSLSNPVQVKGTRDFEELGRQLELLRLRLSELEAQKTQFLRNVSHELKTPLTNIREGAELLQTDNNDISPIEQQTIAKILRENSLRLQRMIEELLRFGTDGEISDTLIFKNIRFHEILNDTIDKNSLASSARAIHLDQDIDQIESVGDPKRLAIIFDNLISNAIKFTPQDGSIKLSLKREDNSIVFDIQDSGPGVSPKDLDKLFDWFFIGEKPPDSIIAGTGMGLAIAQEYAKQHNGDIILIPSKKGAHFQLRVDSTLVDK